ncbi:MAG: HAMP domain-containing sensor histidine kinase [Pseudomonadota bacterium]
MKVRFHYPQSFLKFTLLGFVVAAIPILAGLFYSVLSLDRLARDSQRVVYQGAQAVNGVRDLSESLVAMERGVRQFAILGDQELRGVYDQAHGRFTETGAGLAGLAWAPAQRQLLADLLEGEAALHGALVKGDFSERVVRRKTREFTRLVGMARQLAQHSHQLVDREIAGLRERAEQTRTRVNWMLLGLVPLGMLLALGVPLLIAKPVRQIDAAIRTLREGDLTRPIVLEGPSDVRYLAQRLDWLRQGLLDAEADKTRFLRHLSHELKTPLAALRESADLLFDGTLGDLSPPQEEVVSILRQNSLRLQKLIEDLLAYRSLLAAPGSVQVREFRLGEVLERVLEDQRAALLARSLVVSRSGDDLHLWADPEKLRVIVDNLLSNAIKFSPPAGRIRLEARETDAEVVLEVADQGPGVDPADRPRVFDSFYQGRPPDAAPVRGTGLGLAIAREHALAHGGRIEIVDVHGEGACFRVTLPKGQGIGK